MLVYQLLILSQRIVVLSGTWAILTIALLASLGSLRFDYFFVLYLLGFLILVMLCGPSLSRPQWRVRAGLATLIGVLIFSLITVEKILAILHIRLF